MGFIKTVQSHVLVLLIKDAGQLARIAKREWSIVTLRLGHLDMSPPHAASAEEQES